MKIAFAKSYYGQPEKNRANLSRKNKELIRDIQHEHNPVLMVNRLSSFLFQKPTWYQFFLEKLSFFKPLLCKYDCLSAINFFCKDSVKLMFINYQQDQSNEKLSFFSRVSGFFSLFNRHDSIPKEVCAQVNSAHVASRPMMVA